MSNLLTNLAILLVVLGVLFSSFVLKEDYAFMVYVVAALMPFGFLIFGIGKFWRVIKMIHPVITLAIVILVWLLVGMVNQPFSDSLPYLGVIVTLVLPMLVICLCMNFHDS